MSTPTLDSLFGRVAEIDADRDDRARRAVKAFRALQPTLTAYARVLTKNPRVRVEMAARDNGSTDGHRIFYRPPIALGDPTKHERGKCDRRDGYNQLICKACFIRERVLVTIYHEIAHIAFGTFTPPSATDISDVIQQAIRSVGGWYGDVVKKRIEIAPAYKTKDFINLASLVSEFLPIVYNALEDARVNRELFRARQGVKVMFDADTWRVFTEGVEQADPMTGEVVVIPWNKYPLNMQVIVGIFCKAAGYDYSNWFAPQVIEALNDDELTGLIIKLDTIRNTKGVYYLSFPVLARLVELGYCLEERDEPPLPDPAPNPTPEAEESEEDAESDTDDSGSDGDGGDSDSGTDPGVGGGSDPDDSDETEESEEGDTDPKASGTGSTKEPESDADEAGGTDEEGSGEPGDGSGEAESTGEPDDSDTGSGTDPSRDGDGDDSEGSEPTGGSSEDSESDESEPMGGEGDGSDSALPGSPDGEAAPPAGDSESVDSDPIEQDDSGITGTGEAVSTNEERTDEAESNSGQSSSRDDETDRGSDESEAGDDGDLGDGGEEVDPEAPGDGGASSTGGDIERPRDASGDHSDPPPEDAGLSDAEPGAGEGTGSDDSDIPEPDSEDNAVPDNAVPAPDEEAVPPVADDSEQDAEPIDQGADDGTGGIEVEESAKNDDIPMGTAEEARIGLIKWGGHDDKPKTIAEQDAEAANERAVDRAVIQGIYFETPSRNVFGVREHHYGDPIFAPTRSDSGQRYCMSRGWDTEHYSSDHRRRLGIDADTTTEESVLGGALLKMRVAFADNQRGSDARHRKSGKIDGRVLGRRAALGDDRLFKKRELPGKRNYFVLIGIDISGSTAGINLVLAKKAAFAQANLLTRMGIPFSIYCHSGNFHDPALGRAAGLDLDIYIIKAPSDAWDKHTQRRLQEIGPDSANLDGHTFEYYRKVLDGIQATDKILLYYTDGKMPAENHDEELEILQHELKVCKLKGYHVLGVGIRTDSPKRHGLNTVCVEEDKDISLVIDQLRKELLAASARRG